MLLSGLPRATNNNVSSLKRFIVCEGRNVLLLDYLQTRIPSHLPSPGGKCPRNKTFLHSCVPSPPPPSWPDLIALQPVARYLELTALEIPRRRTPTKLSGLGKKIRQRMQPAAMGVRAHNSPTWFHGVLPHLTKFRSSFPGQLIPRQTEAPFLRVSK